MRIARITLVIGLAVLSGCGSGGVLGDDTPPRSAVVSAIAAMTLAKGATPAEMCQAMALFGGREGLVSLYLSVSTPTDVTGDLESLGEAERAALADHGVTADDVRAAITDSEGNITEQGAAIVADAVIAACGSE